MAVDNLDKSLVLVTRMQNITEKLMSSIEEYSDIIAQVNACGIAFTDYNTQYLEHSGLKHIDGDVVNSCLGQFSAIKTYLETGYNKDPLNKLRTGKI